MDGISHYFQMFSDQITTPDVEAQKHHYHGDEGPLLLWIQSWFLVTRGISGFYLMDNIVARLGLIADFSDSNKNKDYNRDAKNNHDRA